MKSTGIVRKIDKLGRIVLPMELRQNMNIGECDPIEIFVDKDTIVLKKFSPISCSFCGNPEGLIQFKGKMICSECLSELSK